jgi:hypothetical protein
MEQSLSWEANSHSANQGSLPRSQELVIGPCSKPNEPSPQLPTLFP